MPTILKNFVTVRKNHGDILNAPQYRSIVDMIRALLSGAGFAEMEESYREFLLHLLDFSDPHHDSKIDFVPEIIQYIYPIYTNMVETPLSLADFKIKIVPTIGFIELMRRVVLNRYLYNQVRNVDGSVPRAATANLTGDWHHDGVRPGATQLYFTGVINNETDFIRLGWGLNTTPMPTIFNAIDLVETDPALPIIFESSSTIAYFSKDDKGSGYSVPLSFPSSDFTTRLQFVGTPNVDRSLITFTNKRDTISVNVSPNRIVTVVANQVVIVRTYVPVSSGMLEFGFRNDGHFFLRILRSGFTYRQLGKINLKSPDSFRSVALSSPFENLTTTKFAMRSLEIYKGFIRPFPIFDDVPPDGYVFLVDQDGAPLKDPDGAMLMDLNDAFEPEDELPDGLVAIEDRDGTIIRDTDGAIIVEAFVIPDDHVVLTDDDGAFLRDNDGYYLIEADFNLPVGTVILKDADGTFLKDRDGVYLIELKVKPTPIPA